MGFLAFRMRGHLAREELRLELVGVQRRELGGELGEERQELQLRIVIGEVQQQRVAVVQAPQRFHVLQDLQKPWVRSGLDHPSCFVKGVRLARKMTKERGD